MPPETPGLDVFQPWTQVGVQSNTRTQCLNPGSLCGYLFGAFFSCFCLHVKGRETHIVASASCRSEPASLFFCLCLLYMHRRNSLQHMMILDKYSRHDTTVWTTLANSTPFDLLSKPFMSARPRKLNLDDLPKTPGKKSYLDVPDSEHLTSKADPGLQNACCTLTIRPPS